MGPNLPSTIDWTVWNRLLRKLTSAGGALVTWLLMFAGRKSPAFLPVVERSCPPPKEGEHTSSKWSVPWQRVRILCSQQSRWKKVLKRALCCIFVLVLFRVMESEVIRSRSLHINISTSNLFTQCEGSAGVLCITDGWTLIGVHHPCSSVEKVPGRAGHLVNVRFERD